MAYWWHLDPGTGWYRHDTKAEAMRCAKADFECHADHARSEGWSEDSEMLSVWRTEKAKPEDEYDDWIELNGVQIAHVVKTFELDRPTPPDDLEGDALDEWWLENWGYDPDFETIVDYEIREL
ncbi:MAG: hypothetical protein AAGA22_01145 [Pseudomonadota bacterium]